jgi:hypothetical protein
MGDSSSDVAYGCDLGEINPHRPVPGLAHRRDVGFKEAALAEPTRSRKTNRDAVGSRVLKSVELGTTVD